MTDEETTHKGNNGLTKQELQHIMATMNGNGSFDGRCKICSSARKKLETMIAEMPDEFFPVGE